jgi:hypothetical protein
VPQAPLKCEQARLHYWLRPSYFRSR